MSRIQSLFKDVRSGLEPWERTPDRALKEIGRSLRAEDIAQAIADLDSLSATREQIEKETPWDGDATDEVHFAQEELATILKNIPGDLATCLVEGMRSQYSGTRFWIGLTLREIQFPGLGPVMEEALESETCPLNRKVFQEILDASRRGAA
ncbi:MAG TPA: hypothetical protein VN256_24780 [Pyrinomonadaceae bacterium]|nr:hypothetical protein [Pyrinomonadaceae bacterium]